MILSYTIYSLFRNCVLVWVYIGAPSGGLPLQGKALRAAFGANSLSGSRESTETPEGAPSVERRGHCPLARTLRVRPQETYKNKKHRSKFCAFCLVHLQGACPCRAKRCARPVRPIATPKESRKTFVFLLSFGAPSGTRTRDPLIKSQLLYQLS